MEYNLLKDLKLQHFGVYNINFHELSICFDDVETLGKVFEGEAEGYVYSRMSNPVHDALKEIMYSIGKEEAAEVISSGMAAITTSILAH